MSCYQAYGKRVFDIFCSLTGLTVCLPLFVMIPVIIRLESKGPVLFVQRRMGRNGRLFPLFKFRTMRSSSISEKQQFEPGELKRITGFGRLLRGTKLDELPQLLNVLRGDMSFVGPRPEVERYHGFYAREYALVHSVRPGITDPASLKYHNEEGILAGNIDAEVYYETVILPDKLRLGLEYVTSGISLCNDISIIFSTVARIVWK